MRKSVLITALFLSALSVRGSAQTVAPPEAARDWITWGYDQERSGWNCGERTLSPKNVQGLRLKWKSQVSTAPKDVVLSTLTTPIVVEGVAAADGKKDMVFVQGADGSVFALDADSGKSVWQKDFPSAVAPQRKADINCANAVQATPTVDKARGLIFFTTSDGKLHALALATGEERMTPIDMVAPYSRSWSLNLIDNVVYVASARGCGNGHPVEWGSVSAMDVTDLAHPQLSRTYTSKGRPAGPWGRGGAVKGPKGVYVQTSDGPNDPGGNFRQCHRRHPSQGLWHRGFLYRLQLEILERARPGFRLRRSGGVSPRQAQPGRRRRQGGCRLPAGCEQSGRPQFWKYRRRQ